MLLIYAAVCVTAIAGFILTRQHSGLGAVTNICGFLAYATGIALFGTWITGFARERKRHSSERK